MPGSQSSRTIRIATPLGEDAFGVAKFIGTEEMSRLFQFEVELISEHDVVDAKSLVGKNVTLSLTCPGDRVRYFNGHVAKWGFRGRYASQQSGGRGRPLTHYRAILVPWTWFLTRTTDCRIFQGKSVLEIVEQVFGEYGFSDFDPARVSGSYPARDYCVQYRETDFNFLSRLLEEEGIFYYFQHEQGRHVLVLSDEANGTYDCDERDVAFPESTTRSETPQILTWEHEYEFRSGQYAHTDFNFESPSLNLLASERTLLDVPQVGDYEQYDYPGEYMSLDEGRRYARLRMEAEEVHYDLVMAESNCRSFGPGGKFTLTGHYSDGEANQQRLITRIEHRLVHREGTDAADEDAEFDYVNRFTCIPANTVFRPERKTSRPCVRGTQTATVVGPEGELVHTDEYGRVKLQFHWDREGGRDENSSCWVRVSQDWAGAGYGSMYLPHIGQEVIVDFLEGDPDKPIITGRVYNAEQQVPVTLPDQKYVSVVARDHYGNEIVFDGTPDDEHIIIHSPHHDSWLQLGRSVVGFTDSDEDSWTVGNKAEVTVGTKLSMNVGADTSIRMGLDMNATLGLAFQFSVAGSLSWGYGFNYSYFKGTQISNGGKNCYNSCDNDHVINAGNKLSVSGGGGTNPLTPGKNAIVNLSDTAAILSFGKKKSPIRKDSKIQKIAAATSVVAAFATSGLSMTAGEAADDEDMGVSSRKAVAGTFAGMTVGGFSLAAILARLIWEKHDAVKHSEPDSVVRLFDDGIMIDGDPQGEGYMQIVKSRGIQACSTKDIKFFSDADVVLDGKQSIKFQSPQVVATKGIFKTKNIQDLG